jgi:ATP-dependent helicase/nuclease subunit B
MTMTREFLGWERPALESVAERLRERYATGGEWNLERVIVVVPGSRAGRQLLEVLVQRADAWQLRLFPPRIDTVGQLPERLYRSRHPFADDLIQQLTWVEALRQVGAERVGAALARLPADGPAGRTADWPRWLELAKVLWRLHRELAAEGLDFQKVAEQIGVLAGDERPRWELLAQVQEAYHGALDRRELWDRQTARLVAIRQAECATDDDIFLVAVADMNQTIQRMLRQVAARVTAWVYAPRELAERFDDLGCLVPERWLDVSIPLHRVPLLVAEGPAEQAETVAGVLAQWAPNYTETEIVVAAPDERLVPYLERQLEDCGVAVHRAAGDPLSQSLPYRLLEAVAQFLPRRRVRDFAALVRHPDLLAWLTATCPGFRLEQFDRYAAEHLPPVLGEWLGDPEGPRQHLEPVVARIERWLAPLERPTAHLATWSDGVSQLLQEVYGEVRVDRRQRAGQRQWLSCQAIQSSLQLLADIPADVDPQLSASEALHLILDQLRGQTTPVVREPEDLEILGWLELPLDTAPALIVTSFNEGFVPTSVNADQFLPNSLRKRLNLLDNQRRYARDAYALQLLAGTRERLTLVVGRRDAEGDPLIPSRLAFAADEETIARRVLRLLGHDEVEELDKSETPALPESPRISAELGSVGGRGEVAEPGWAGGAGVPNGDRETGFQIPRPEPSDQPLLKLPVTAFRSYLSCPYRFYLQYVLRLEAESDRGTELDAAQFGVLLHRVLDAFAAGPCRDEMDEEPIRAFLRSSLEELANHELGTRRLAPVNLQLGQLKARLDGFAAWQAARAREGWRIRHQEEPCEAAPSFLKIGRRQVVIRGRIDRIDYHEQRDEWAVLDYKSSDTPKKPRAAHQRSGEWVDLQLPLYRHLAAELGVPPQAQLGYIVLPKDTSKVGVELADWDDAELADADRQAAEVARAILEQHYWPPSDRPPPFPDQFTGICQDSVFHRGEWGEESETSDDDRLAGRRTS